MDGGLGSASPSGTVGASLSSRARRGRWFPPPGGGGRFGRAVVITIVLRLTFLLGCGGPIDTDRCAAVGTGVAVGTPVP